MWNKHIFQSQLLLFCLDLDPPCFKVDASSATAACNNERLFHTAVALHLRASINIDIGGGGSPTRSGCRMSVYCLFITAHLPWVALPSAKCQQCLPPWGCPWGLSNPAFGGCARGPVLRAPGPRVTSVLTQAKEGGASQPLTASGESQGRGRSDGGLNAHVGL